MNEKRLSSVYRFRCADVLEHFEKLPVERQATIEKYIVDVIFDSFVKPADEDYVTARLLVQKKMYRAFFWAASQAVEKYLKAFLLMRGASVNRRCFKGHRIVVLYEEAYRIDAALTVNTKRHPKITIDPNVCGLIDELSVDQFLKDIETKGSSDSRYNSSGIEFNFGYLFALDSFAFGLRQQIGVPPVEENLRKMDRYLIEAFKLYNPWFEPSIRNLRKLPNDRFPLGVACSVTTLDFLVSANQPNEAIHVLRWLDKKMQLPSQVKQYLNRA